MRQNNPARRLVAKGSFCDKFWGEPPVLTWTLPPGWELLTWITPPVLTWTSPPGWEFSKRARGIVSVSSIGNGPGSFWNPKNFCAPVF